MEMLPDMSRRVSQFASSILELHRYCRERLPQAQVSIRFINVAEPPRPASRKVDRHRLDANGAWTCQDQAPEHAEVLPGSWKAST